MAINTLQDSVNWAQPFIEYAPLTAGINLEPAVSIASIVRNVFLAPPLTWSWNRNEDSSQFTTAGTQDYIYTNLPDFGFLEKVSLVDSRGNIIEMKDVFNNAALAVASQQDTPHAVSVITNTPGVKFKIRFMGVPDDKYNIVLTYQKIPTQFHAFSISSVQAASGGQTTYIGNFNPVNFPTTPVVAEALVANLTNAGNNGLFPVVSCTPTALVLSNAVGVIETAPASAVAINVNWDPIPDDYSDIYNNLFLGESFTAFDDARSQVYRQRGILMLLAKQEGLTDMQKNIFAQQYLAQGKEDLVFVMKGQQSVQARAV